MVLQEERQFEVCSMAKPNFEVVAFIIQHNSAPYRPYHKTGVNQSFLKDRLL